MFKKLNNKKGFTLMEMLIVVAIIAILIAIAIPTFSNALHKARVAADQASVRSYYAVVSVDALTGVAKSVPASVAKGAELDIDGTAKYTMQAGSLAIAATAATASDTAKVTLTYTCDKMEPGCKMEWIIDNENGLITVTGSGFGSGGSGSGT